MSTTPESLAAELEHNDCARDTRRAAAAELRRLAAVEAERDQLREHLEFVERWAVHHGSKASVTPEEALSVIQHYPAIKAITKGYADGKVPETRDPWAEADQLRAEVEALRADAERWRFIVDEALQDTRRDKGLGYYCVGVRVPYNGVMALAEQMDPGPSVDLAMQGMSVQEIRDALRR